MDKREEFQEECRKLSKIHPLLVVQAGTGVGKTLAILKCIESDNSGIKWLILVPEILQIINLQNEIEKHNMEFLYEKIEDVICYASFSQYEGKNLNIWANEGQHLSKLRISILKTINFQKIIVDSATIPDDVVDRLVEIGRFYYFKYSLKKAINEGIIASPETYTVSVEVDGTVKRNKVVINKKSFLLTDIEYIQNVEKSLSYWKTRMQEHPKETWIIRKLTALGGQRKEFFSKCKTERVKELLTSLGDRRFVCFTGSVSQCDELGGDRAVHSKKTRKQNISILESFNNSSINSIFFNKMGAEGMNLEGIGVGVVVQLSTGNDDGLQIIQKVGRALRSKSPSIYILYCKGTKDEDFLKRALKQLNIINYKEL